MLFITVNCLLNVRFPSRRMILLMTHLMCEIVEPLSSPVCSSRLFKGTQCVCDPSSGNGPEST